jgi:hypothetical protein
MPRLKVQKWNVSSPTYLGTINIDKIKIRLRTEGRLRLPLRRMNSVKPKSVASFAEYRSNTPITEMAVRTIMEDWNNEPSQNLPSEANEIRSIDKSGRTALIFHGIVKG